MRDWAPIAANYRPMVGDVLHPDECVTLRIQGAEWRVRPLQLPDGIRYTPEFGDKVSLKQTVDPMGNQPMQDLAAELIEFLDSEPEGLDAILAVCAYIGELLDQQYELTNEQKADLLAFRGADPPPWFMQGVRHATGLEPIVTTLEMMRSVLPADDEPMTDNKPWWKFW